MKGIAPLPWWSSIPIQVALPFTSDTADGSWEEETDEWEEDELDEDDEEWLDEDEDEI